MVEDDSDEPRVEVMDGKKEKSIHEILWLEIGGGGN